jgi:hypothetical protein
MDEAEIRRLHDAHLPHPRHPAPLGGEKPAREPTAAERLWELHDRGFLSDADYAAALAELG